MSTPENNEITEAATPTRIGAGSFATVYSLHGQPFVFKVVQHAERARELDSEFHALHSLYLQCNANSFFAIPRAIAYYNPATDEVVAFPLSPGSGRIRDRRPLIDQHFFESITPFGRAAYAMDRANALPSFIGKAIRRAFYHDRAKAANVEPPLICRLYFGRTLQTSAFVNSVNFPIDVARYNVLYGSLETYLSSIDEIVDGMGEMLGRIHWLSGFDGRDIEFIMAGAGNGAVRYYVIDFNQMRRFDAVEDDIGALSDSFFSNDPYYPRPRPDDHLYELFKRAYLRECPDCHKGRAREFLAIIESTQADRDAKA